MTPAFRFGGQRARRAGRAGRARRLLEVTLWAAFLLGWFVALRPQGLGGPVEYLVIRGDSMAPTYRTGDLVVVRAEGDYRAGDIVAYRVPEGELGAGRLVIHRLIASAPGLAFVVQGDNNPAPDPWQPRASDIAGRAWLTVPAVGRVASVLHQPALLAALAVALLAGAATWRRSRSTGAVAPPVTTAPAAGG